MPEFFLELFSEEIPARMQREAAVQLEKLCNTALAALKINVVEIFTGPRRIAVKAILQGQTEARQIEERGPRDTAPEAALAGFLGKHKAARTDVVAEGGYFLLRRMEPAVDAAALIASALPAALAKFAWPKSMRWGESGDFTWVRPLRRMVCLLDGKIIPVKLGPVTAGNETEGHRFLSPGAFKVVSAEDWQEKLRDRHVIVDQEERRRLIVAGLNEKAAELGLTVADDPGLIDEVSGLVEWPVPLIGKIDDNFMDLPPEVRELSMKVNQRYFALRDEIGKPAPYFAFVSNIEALDGGRAIIAGNERVLRARLSDARHFWDLDLKTPLNELLPKLDKITFHANIGTQGERVKRIATLAGEIASTLGANEEIAEQARIAGLLSKADLVTGMVGEFPELQGIMGGYYAERNPRGWKGEVVGPAIATHYQPKGPSDAVPTDVVPVSVGLADKLDTLIQFFRVDEKPTGSGDPYALRRAALGIIRIILENNLAEIDLGVTLFDSEDVFAFILDRLKVKLRNEHKRFDVLEAVLSVSADGNLVRLMKRVNALNSMLTTEDGKNLHASYKRAANILKIGDPPGAVSKISGAQNYQWLPAETELVIALNAVRSAIEEESLERYELYSEIMSRLASLRPAIDAFFETVTVNDPVPEVRQSRLQLLSEFCRTVHIIADFSKIEG
jgi:glycyl-tRNA synthetase beta chain